MKKVDVSDVQNRLLSLDALRGLAILLMVLSGSIAFGDVLPAWMYHAQVPPPTHTFNPNIAGLTWVDLVFPFFLFSMGAAFPLALSKKLKNSGVLATLGQTIKRYILLIFFAVFTFHSRAWVMTETPATIENIISIGCFLVLFLMFSKTNFERSGFAIGRQILGFALAIAFMWLYPFKDGGFNIFKSDIIIVVLANMAFFGSLIWIFTQHKPWLRVSVLPLVMAIFLSGKVADSWVSQVYNWSPLPWAYTFYYLKYLFIIIPGTFAGDWLLKTKNNSIIIKPSLHTLAITIICLLLVVLNTSMLFTRQLVSNVIITITLAIVLVFLCRKSTLEGVYQNFIYIGIFLLILGLFFEPYEGGIKKDPSTYSYYFVCSGMAFLTIFSIFLVFDFNISFPPNY